MYKKAFILIHYDFKLHCQNFPNVYFKVSSNLSKDKWFNKLLTLHLTLQDKILHKPQKQLKMGTFNTVFSENMRKWVIYVFCIFM